MMAVYKTYKEAVLANGSTKGVYQNLQTRWFSLDTLSPGNWIECNPSFYLETLESFLAGGKLLVKYDLYTERDGSVDTVHDPSIINKPNSMDNELFILQAAADQVETPEEKEAFDAIDTTPNQVESLSCSEKPNSSEWKPKSGQPVYIAQINTLAGVKEKRYFVSEYWCNSGHQREYLECGILFPTKEEAEIKTKAMLGIPLETPAEREDRERLEAAYDLYLAGVGDMPALHFDAFVDHADFCLAIVDKTGYRKQ